MSGICEVNLRDWLAQYNTKEKLLEQLSQSKKETLQKICSVIEKVQASGFAKSRICQDKEALGDLCRLASVLRDIGFFTKENFQRELDPTCQDLRIRALFHLSVYGLDNYLNLSQEEFLTKEEIDEKAIEVASKGGDKASLFFGICSRRSPALLKKFLEMVDPEELPRLLETQNSEGNTALLQAFLEWSKLRNRDLTDSEYLEREKRILDLKEIIISLIDKGANLSQQCGDITPLTCAIVMGDIHIFKKIIYKIPKEAQKAFIDKENKVTGSRAIYHALKNKRVELVNELMDRSPKLFFNLETGETVLHVLDRFPFELKDRIYSGFISEMSKSFSIPLKMDLKPLIRYLKRTYSDISEQEYLALISFARGDHPQAKELMQALEPWTEIDVQTPLIRKREGHEEKGSGKKRKVESHSK